ncbi:MAG: 50S ribosomal protein L9 [Rhodospirillales bacterium]
MEVLLLERIESLGQMGDLVKVKTGFARNYLLPQGKALRATDENRKRFDSQRAQLEAVNLERRTEAEAIAEKAGAILVMLVRQAGEAGQLYGSVSARDVADAVTEAGVTIDRRQVRLERPIKSIGLHKLRIDLHPEVHIFATVNVARSLDEAETQAKTGRALIHREEVEEVEEKLVTAAADDSTEIENDSGDDRSAKDPEAEDLTPES